nr:TlpA disulfide reductase family protein [Microbulbifer guangxiensis]
MAAVISGCERADNPAFRTVSGETVDTGGKTLLINYWAEWCKPCREEIPELNFIAAEHDDVLVLGVNYDPLTAEEIAAQAEKLGIEFPVLANDPAGLWQRPRPQVLPTTLVIGPDNRWRATLVGPQTADSLESALGLGSGKE